MTESDERLRRPRRLRRTPAIRALVEETQLRVDNLVMPLFVREGDGEPEPVDSMPGQVRWPLSRLGEAVDELTALGLRAIALFPVLEPESKDPVGSEALRDESLILRAVRAVRERKPEVVIFADIALDPYTDHGHDGVLTEAGDDVDNDATVAILCRMAVIHARAGVDFVAPSDMMDGRIGAIRRALDASGYSGTGILSYSAKYASAFYGPFRDAVGTARAAGTRLLDKKTYQMNPANRREAVVETGLDEAEGADILMVKPAGPYLDVIRELRARTPLPVAAYQVSGEYAQIHAAGRLGWLDLEAVRDESLLSIKRAGADLIFTYFAKDIAAKAG